MKQEQKKWAVNRFIRATNVVCIDQDNNNLGVISFNDALKLAQSNELDLVQMAPAQKDNPPTCKIMNFGKFKYETSKKTKKVVKNNFDTVKIIKFRPSTGLNDLKTKANQTNKFLHDNFKVKAVVVFKKREMSHKDIGIETMDKYLDMVTDYQTLSNRQFSQNGEYGEISILLAKK